MSTDKSALIYFLQKTYYKFVKNLIDKNVSVEDILKELKAVELEKQNTNIKKVEIYAQKYLGREWDYKEKTWKEADQISGFVGEYEVELEMNWGNNSLILSENDAKTMLKDMKVILSNVKKITYDIDKVVKDIDTIVAAFSAMPDLNDKNS